MYSDQSQNQGEGKFLKKYTFVLKAKYEEYK